jgi:hypothetical protein
MGALYVSVAWYRFFGPCVVISLPTLNGRVLLGVHPTGALSLWYDVFGISSSSSSMVRSMISKTSVGGGLTRFVPNQLPKGGPMNMGPQWLLRVAMSLACVMLSSIRIHFCGPDCFLLGNKGGSCIGHPLWGSVLCIWHCNSCI